MLHPRSQEGVGLPSTSISVTSTPKHSLSEDGNLTHSNTTAPTASCKQQQQENENERFDIELGVARLVPLRLGAVRQVMIPPRISTQSALVSSPSPQVQGKPQVPPRPKRRVGGEPAGLSEKKEEEVGGGGGGKEETPPPPSRLPPPIPPRPKRKLKPAQTSVERVESTSTQLHSSPRLAPSTPAPIESQIPEPTRRAPEQPEKRGGVVGAPAPGAQCSGVDVDVVGSVSDSANRGGGGGAEAGEECGFEGEGGAERRVTEIFDSGNWNPSLMRRMYSDYLAGRGIFEPNRLRLEALRDELEMKIDGDEEEAEEAREVYIRQRKFFGLADGGEFWDPFVEMGICEGDMGEILRMGMGVSPKTKGRGKGEGEGSVRVALGYETLHGLMVSPRIVGMDVEGEERGGMGSEGNAATSAESTIEAAAPEKEGGAYDDLFNGWSSFSPEDGNAEDDKGLEEQNEIINPFAGQFAVPGNEWTALLAQRRESGSSDYSAPSRPASPVPHLRSGETLFYSPIQNPWVSAIDSVKELSHFLEAAIDFFSGFDVEALVASTQEPGYELAETDSGKGSPERFHLEPHKPKPSCGCEFCSRHHHPTLEILKTHDPSEWCHCSACRDFRDNRNMEKNRAEQNTTWKARLDELATEVDDARAEEESRMLDLQDFKEEDNQEEFKPKKTHRLGDWVRSHLRNPSPRE